MGENDRPPGERRQRRGAEGLRDGLAVGVALTVEHADRVREGALDRGDGGYGREVACAAAGRY